MGSSAANALINLFVPLIMAILILMIRNNKDFVVGRHYFMAAAICCAMCGLCLGITWALESNPVNLYSDIMLTVDKVFTVGLYIFLAPEACCFVMYIVENCRVEDKVKKVVMVISIIFTVAHTAVAVLNLFTPLIFEIVPGIGYLRYTQLPFFYISYVMNLLFPIYALIISIIYRNNITRESLLIYILYPVMILLLSLVQVFYPILSIVHLGCAITLFIAFRLNNKKNSTRIIAYVILSTIIFSLFITIQYSSQVSYSKYRSEWKAPANTGTRKVIRVAALKDNSPYSYVRSDGTAIGYDVELIYSLAEKMDADVQLVLGDWNEIYSGLKSGSYDLLLGVNLSEKTQSSLSVSRFTNHDTFNLYCVTGNNDGIGFESTVAIKSDDSFSSLLVLKNLFPSIPSDHIQIYDSYQACLDAVTRKAADTALVPSHAFEDFVNSRLSANIDVVMSDIDVAYYGIAALRSRSELIDEIDEVLSKLNSEGVIADLNNHWVIPQKEMSVTEFIHVNRMSILFGIFTLLIIIALSEVFFLLRAAKFKDALIAQKDLTKVAEQERDTDDVSNCLTRKAFIRNTEDALWTAMPYEYTVVCIDISHFKEFNERFGHVEGDRLLSYLGKYNEVLGRSGFMCRARADVFFALVRTDACHKAFGADFDRHMAGFDSPSKVHYRKGAFMVGETNVSALTCMDNAITAMRSRGQVSNNIIFYDKAIREQALREQIIINSAEQALQNNEFVAYYQPIVNRDNEGVVGADLVAVWNHPELGIIYPEEFVPILENNGMITDLDKLMVRRACELQKKAMDAGITTAPLSVSIHKIGENSGTLKDWITGELKTYSIPAKSLRIEIKESLYSKNSKKLSFALDELHREGIKIILDDFGSGYSNINSLMSLPVDVVKLSSSLVNGVDKDHKSSLILTSIIRMAKWLGIIVVANGVTSENILDAVYNSGCKIIQGEYFYKPMLEEDYIELLRGKARSYALPENLGPRPIASFESAIVGDVFDIIQSDDNTTESINSILELVGEYYGVDRAYIFEDTSDNKNLSNTYEWCRKGIRPIHNYHQYLSYEAFLGSHIEKNFDEFGVWNISDSSTIADSPLKHLLVKHGIIAMLNIALYERDKFIGYLGFVNSNTTSWTSGQINTLRMIARIVSNSVIEKLHALDEKQLNDYYRAIYNQDDYVTILADDFTIRFANRKTLETFGDCVGCKCHEVFIGQIVPCEGCPCISYKNTGSAGASEHNGVDGICMIETASPLTFEGENCFMVVSKDITELKNTSEEVSRISEANNRLEDALSKLSKANHEIIRITDQLIAAKTGLWIIENEEGKAPRMIADRGMRLLIGVGDEATPEECYSAWFGGIREGYHSLIDQGIKNMLKNENAEIVFPWYYPDGRVIYVRFVGSANRLFTGKGYSVGGYHQDVSDMVITQMRKDSIISELRETQDNTAELLAKMDIGSWTIEKEEGVPVRMMFDANMRRMFGIPDASTPEECYQQWFSGLAEEDREVMEEFDRTCSEKGIAEVIYHWFDKDGVCRYIRCDGVLDRSDNNQYLRISGMSFDVTESAMAQEERNNYINAVGNMYVAIIRANLKNGMCTTLRSTPLIDALIPRDASIETTVAAFEKKILDPEVAQSNRDFWLARTIKAHLKESEVLSREILTKSFGWMQLNFVAYNRDDTGEITEVLCIARLIDEIKKAHLEQTRRVTAIASKFDFAYFCDIQTDELAEVNNNPNATERTIESKPAQKTMCDWVNSTVSSDYVKDVMAFVDFSTLNERYKKNSNLTIEFIDGNGVWMLSEIIPVEFDNYGSLKQIVIATHNIEREKALLLEAEKANKAKTAFLSSMSHDIRTPMNAIIGLTDTTLEHKDDAERVDGNLRKIKASGIQLVSLINDVLDVSVIESGKVTLKIREYNIEAGFNQYCSLFSSQFESKNIAADFSIHDIRSPWVMADEMRVRQIFINLLGNAFKYTPSGKSVSFEMYQEEDANGKLNTIGIVKDSGIGMSEEFMETMWEPFSRADDERTKPVKGTGLGLSIVRSFVDLMHGSVEVESELEKGSMFKVTLPLEPTEHMEIGVQEDTVSNARIECHVLLADDNDINWEIASELLQMRGVTCERAVNGKDALDKFEASAPGTYDAILMDIQMPIMDGLTATKHIRASSHSEASTVPVIAMTANAFTEDVERCLAAGMNEHLSKPIDIDIVVATLRKHVKKA